MLKHLFLYLVCTIVREYGFYVFWKIQKTRLFTFFWSVMSKKRKKRRKRCPGFHFLHFEIANEHFHCKTITHNLHISCYTYNIILITVHFWLKYNGFARQQNWVRVVTVVLRTIGILLRFLCFFTLFWKS